MRAARLVEEEELKRTKARGARVAMRENMVEVLGLMSWTVEVCGVYEGVWLFIQQRSDVKL